MSPDEEKRWSDVATLWVDKLVNEPSAVPPPIRQRKSVTIRYLHTGAKLRVNSDVRDGWPGIPLRIAGAPGQKEWALRASRRRWLPTGMAVDIPQGYLGMVVPRTQPQRDDVLIVEMSCVLPGWDKEVMVCVHNAARDASSIRCGSILAHILVVPLAGLPGNVLELQQGEREENL